MYDFALKSGGVGVDFKEKWGMYKYDKKLIDGKPTIWRGITERNDRSIDLWNIIKSYWWLKLKKLKKFKG
jgi:hypothetical protein